MRMAFTGEFRIKSDFSLMNLVLGDLGSFASTIFNLDGNLFSLGLGVFTYRLSLSCSAILSPNFSGVFGYDLLSIGFRVNTSTLPDGFWVGLRSFNSKSSLSSK